MVQLHHRHRPKHRCRRKPDVCRAWEQRGDGTEKERPHEKKILT
jgi:hypothetical protein